MLKKMSMQHKASPAVQKYFADFLRRTVAEQTSVTVSYTHLTLPTIA